ncbi:MAG: YcaO-like family protein [Pseudomonadota bacterium]
MTASYFDLGGTLRAQTPEQTLDWLQTKLDTMGITRVANITGLDNIGIFVSTCIRPNSKHLSVSQGKGINANLAQISAMMEAVEGFHIEQRKPPALRGSYLHLHPDHAVIHPNRFIATDFQPDLSDYPLDWIAVANLFDKQNYYLPQILFCLDTTLPQPEFNFFNVSSNGIAAGNTLVEAQCHALYELIERDSLARWQQLSDAQLAATKVNLNSISDEHICHLLEQFQQAKIQVELWEITSQIGVPAFQAAIHENNALRRLNLFTGSGAHLCKNIAALRALTEAAQSRLTLISGNRDDIFPSYYQTLQIESKTSSVVSLEAGQRDFQNCTSFSLPENFTAQLQLILSLLKQQEIEAVFMLDHSLAEINIPVVQLIIPELLFNGERN